MNTNEKILKILLIMGGIYFLLVSIAHLIGLKMPGLFIYYNVPSYEYQDKIISFLAFGWSMFFFITSTDIIKYQSIVKILIIIGLIAVLGLSFINLTADFNLLYNEIDTTIFWIQTGILSIYLFSIFWFSVRLKVDKPLKNED